MKKYAAYVSSLKGQKGSLGKLNEQDAYTFKIGTRQITNCIIEEVGEDYVVMKGTLDTIVIPLNLFVVQLDKY